MSLPQIDDAFIRRSTWPGPGSGTSSSTVSTVRPPGSRTPLILATRHRPAPCARPAFAWPYPHPDPLTGARGSRTAPRLAEPVARAADFPVRRARLVAAITDI